MIAPLSFLFLPNTLCYCKSSFLFVTIHTLNIIALVMWGRMFEMHLVDLLVIDVRDLSRMDLLNLVLGIWDGPDFLSSPGMLAFSLA